MKDKLMKEIELCNRYKEAIGQKNRNLISQYKQGEISKQELQLKFTKNNYWLNHYDNHIGHCEESIKIIEKQNHLLVRNALFLLAFGAATLSTLLLSPSNITGFAVKDLNAQFKLTYAITALLAILAVAVYFKGDELIERFLEG